MLLFDLNGVNFDVTPLAQGGKLRVAVSVMDHDGNRVTFFLNRERFEALTDAIKTSFDRAEEDAAFAERTRRTREAGDASE